MLDGGSLSIKDKAVLEFGCHSGELGSVLGALGARVTGVDPDPRAVEAARASAARHGLAGRTCFMHVPLTSPLPFDDESFDLISCAGVLQLVRDDLLEHVQGELDRVLKPGGQIIVSATASRPWPREPHHGRWLVNYVPRSLDPIVYGQRTRRGTWPWRIRSGKLEGYRDMGHEGGGRRILQSLAREDVSPRGLLLHSVLNGLLVKRGGHCGNVSPQIAAVLQKP